MIGALQKSFWKSLHWLQHYKKRYWKWMQHCKKSFWKSLQWLQHCKKRYWKWMQHCKKGFENVASFYVGCNLPNNLSSPGLRCLCGDYDLVKTVANQIVENDNELCTLLSFNVACIIYKVKCKHFLVKWSEECLSWSLTYNI